jgi:hypothetical protein
MRGADREQCAAHDLVIVEIDGVRDKSFETMRACLVTNNVMHPVV